MNTQNMIVHEPETCEGQRMSAVPRQFDASPGLATCAPAGWRRAALLALACGLEGGCMELTDAAAGNAEIAPAVDELSPEDTGDLEREIKGDIPTVELDRTELAPDQTHPWTQNSQVSFTWYQGWGPVPMGSADDRFCFLTEVSGNFEGGGEYVHVFSYNGGWYLGGSSYQRGVMASARCISRSWFGQTLNYSDEYTWSQENPNHVFMGSWSNRVCFLTRVQGDFEGGGERVHAYRNGGSWWLGGTSYQNGVAVGARCVDTSYRSGPYNWNQTMANPVLMQSADWWACGLNLFTGKFEGGGEAVRAFPSGSWWYLGGSSLQRDVATESYCL